MEYQYRQLTEHLQQLAAHFSVVVLSGARQVGKSTLLAHAFAGYEVVTFDPSQDIGNARRDPELFLDAHPGPTILDEIQYAPELVPALKRRVDASSKPGQYILTGSQQWAVLQTANESLAGRAIFIELEGFSLAEMNNARADWLTRYLADPVAFTNAPIDRLASPRSVHEVLFRGFLPQATQLPMKLLRRFHDSYVTTYIERDIRLLAEIEDRQLFGRFAQLAAALTAQEINHSQLGRELGISYKTAQRWLRILRDTFQWMEVPAFHANAVKRASGKSKGYFADTGLACALQKISSPVALLGHPLTGALFESAVGAEIRKHMASMDAPPRLHHWRSYAGAEVDLLLEQDGTYFPIEIKLASRPSRADTRGLRAFREAHPQLNIAPGLVIAPAEAKLPLNDKDWVLPWDAV
jgi:predicted AAA+ superfamily ATPase